MVTPERGGQRPDPCRNQRGLLEVIGNDQERRHGVLSFLASSRSVRSASLTSSSVSLPVSMRRDTTGLLSPPNSARRSSTSRFLASSREIAASKIFALLIRLTQRTACFDSSR